MWDAQGKVVEEEEEDKSLERGVSEGRRWLGVVPPQAGYMGWCSPDLTPRYTGV